MKKMRKNDTLLGRDSSVAEKYIEVRKVRSNNYIFFAHKKDCGEISCLDREKIQKEKTIHEKDKIVLNKFEQAKDVQGLEVLRRSDFLPENKINKYKQYIIDEHDLFLKNKENYSKESNACFLLAGEKTKPTHSESPQKQREERKIEEFRNKLDVFKIRNALNAIKNAYVTHCKFLSEEPIDQEIIGYVDELLDGMTKPEIQTSDNTEEKGDVEYKQLRI